MKFFDVTHTNGTDWFEAPLPRRFHRCRPWTFGFGGGLTYVERCACGAIRLDHRVWLERNSRRRTP